MSNPQRAYEVGVERLRSYQWGLDAWETERIERAYTDAWAKFPTLAAPDLANVVADHAEEASVYEPLSEMLAALQAGNTVEAADIGARLLANLRALHANAAEDRERDIIEDIHYAGRHHAPR